MARLENLTVGTRLLCVAPATVVTTKSVEWSTPRLSEGHDVRHKPHIYVAEGSSKHLLRTVSVDTIALLRPSSNFERD